MLSPRLRLVLPNELFPSGFSTKFLYAIILSSIVLRAPPILVLIWSRKKYLVSSTNPKVPCYVVFSNSLLPRPS